MKCNFFFIFCSNETNQIWDLRFFINLQICNKWKPKISNHFYKKNKIECYCLITIQTQKFIPEILILQYQQRQKNHWVKKAPMYLSSCTWKPQLLIPLEMKEELLFSRSSRFKLTSASESPASPRPLSLTSGCQWLVSQVFCLHFNK